MIHTISLCPECYKKIPATIKYENGMAVMEKECDVHGEFSAIVEKDAQHVSNFYRPGTLGRNNHLLINIYDKCNMKCPWCYYTADKKDNKPFDYYDVLLKDEYLTKGFGLILSGGEPTIRPDFFEFVNTARLVGWRVSSMTNMLKLGDEAFFRKTINSDNFITNGHGYRFSMSMQHPKNYSRRVYKKKLQALKHLDISGLRAECLAFSITSLDELDFIKDFYDTYKHLFTMLRIRTMFNNWGHKGEKKIFLSDLHRAFLEKFNDYSPVISEKDERSNIYCLYMETKEGRSVSLASAPTVHNVDYHLCHRPVYMLGNDNTAYSIPVAQIINEGISLGWKDGFQIKEVK